MRQDTRSPAPVAAVGGIGDTRAIVGDSRSRASGSRFSALLREHRERLLLSQEELAARSGLSTRAIRYLEDGQVRRPRSMSVRLLADALGLAGRPRAAFELAAMGRRLEVGSAAGSGAQGPGPPESGAIVPGAAHASFSSPPPALLPMTVPAFVGRQAEIASLDLLVADGEAAPVVICAVSGTAGVGKTALAVHWAHRVRAWFPDGQLYLNLRGFEAAVPPVHPGEAIRVFLDALAVPTHRIPVGLAEQVGLYRSLVADRRILVVLDNARDSEQVRPLLPGGDAGRVVITSRNRLLGLVASEGARPLPLGTMDAGDADELLRRRLGSGRVDREPEAAAEIVARCGGLPLALALVAARVAAHPRVTLQELALELQGVTPLDSMTTGQDQATDLRQVFSRSYATLSAQGQAMFQMLGLHPGPQIAAATAASMANQSLEETRRILVELHDAGLVTEIAPGSYTLHDLLHAYARELSEREESEADRDAAIRRLLDHALFTAVNADRQLEPHRDPIDLPAPCEGTVPEVMESRAAALTWFAQKYPGLVRAVELATARGLDEHAWRLPWALVTYFDLQGRWRPFKATQNLALAAAQRLGNVEAEGRALRHLANASIQTGDFDEADKYLQRALTLFEGLGDAAAQANAHMNLSLLRERQERIEESNDQAAQALRLYRAAGHRVGEGIALNSLGYGYALVGEFPAALEHCHQALELDRANGHRKGRPTRRTASGSSTADSVTMSRRPAGSVTPSTCSGSSATATTRPMPSSISATSSPPWAIPQQPHDPGVMRPRSCGSSTTREKPKRVNVSRAQRRADAPAPWPAARSRYQW
jgi:tetratricopeptide (TPR) repeat protein/DNA-binding XRE family transcriptional regulator